MTKDFTMIKTLCQMTEEQLAILLIKYLKSKKYKPISSEDYILASGDIPILLVAHIDTVFEELPVEIYYDNQRQVMWSPQGLGADDRAGVLGIIKILEDDFRPHILFLSKEENMCEGALTFIKHFTKLPFNCKYIIELDRQGVCDCVFYNCLNQTFQSYIESFGFITAKGSYTDISVLAPYLDLAAVNLSIGYLDEHSYTERLNLNCLNETVKKVKKILMDAENVGKFNYN